MMTRGEETPLEFLLRIMRDETVEWSTRFEAAKAAAPYVHPRLAAVHQTVEAAVKHEQSHQDVLDELARKLDRRAAVLRASRPEPH